MTGQLRPTNCSKYIPSLATFFVLPVIVLTRFRTDHGSVTHRYLLNKEERPGCIPPHSNYSLKHSLMVCADLVESR